MARKGQHPCLTFLRKRAEKLGATLDESTYDAGFVNLDAPHGFVWGATGDTHSLCVCWAHPGHKYGSRLDEDTRTVQGDAIVDALERLEYGLAPCDDAECDRCQQTES